MNNYWDEARKRWISPEGNEYDPSEGLWRDPRTGNYQDETGTWTSSTGDKYDGSQWIPRAAIGQTYSAPGATATMLSSSSGVDPKAAQLRGAQQQLVGQRAALDTSQNVLNSRANVIQAQRGLIAPQRAVIGANREVLGQQSRLTVAERALIAEQQRANALRMGEEQSIQAARRDIPGINKASQEQFQRNTMAYRDDIAHVPHPIDVDVPEGVEANFGPGVRASIRLPEEYAVENAQEAQAIRAIDLEAARLIVSLIGTDVDLARQVAQQHGMDLDEAQLIVQMAGDDLDIAQLQDQQADLNIRRYGVENTVLPPFPGAVQYTDPITAQTEWLTPYEASLRQKAFTQSQKPAEEETAVELAQLSVELLQRLVVRNPQREAEVLEALKAKGYTPAAAQEIIDDAKARAAKTPAGTTSGGGTSSGGSLDDLLGE